MFCSKCGSKIEDGALFCQSCGTKVEAPVAPIVDATPVVEAAPEVEVAPEVAAEPVVEPTPVVEPVYAEPTPVTPVYNANEYQQPENTNYNPFAQYNLLRPLSTSRGLLKYIFLGLITFGIYDVWQLYEISEDIDTIATKHDGNKTMNFILMMELSPLTLFILMFVWYHHLCNRIGKELIARGIDYNISAKTYWLWNILGSLIIVGPFIFIHKLMKAMNLLSADFNAKNGD